MPDAAFIAALLAGLTGSAHCVAMCGGFLAAHGAPALRPLLPARRLRLERAATQAGRLATYMALGALLGAVGGAAFALSWPAWQRVLYAGANVALLLTALTMAGAALPVARLEGAGLALLRRVAPLAQRQGGAQGLRGRFVTGLLWGLTPCALIYGVLPIALLAGSAARGALVLAGLWLGTLPALTVAGGLLRMALGKLPAAGPRLAAAALTAGFALLGLYRVLAAPESLAAGPFCLLP